VLPKLTHARDHACITCGRGDIPLDARHFRRRERMATRFDSRNVAGQCTKENRFKGGNLQKFSLAIGKGTLQLVQLSSQS
jgi:Bacteriophage Lambda NinG protein